MLTWGIFFISFSTLIFEITLIRLTSVVLATNLAFIGISVALFGIALGGILVYIKPNFFTKENFQKRLSVFSILYAISLTLFVIIFLQIDFSGRALRSILNMLMLASVPFVLGNICLTLLFKFKSKRINSLYFYDLVGASLGVLAAVILLNVFTGINVILIAGFFGLLAAIFFSHSYKRITLISVILLLFSAGFIIINHNQNYLDIIYSKQGREEGIIFSKWNSFSRVSVQKKDNPRIVVSIPVEKLKDHPPQLGIEIDAGAYTPIIEFNGDFETIEFLKSDLSSLAFQL